jgi:DNA processing protein
MSGSFPDGLPERAYAAALAALPSMSFRRLAALLRAHPPEEAFAVVGGRAAPAPPVAAVLADPAIGQRWRAAATPALVEQVWLSCAATQVDVVHLGASTYPQRLDGRDAPPVLFVRGDAALLDDGRRVAIVGTRNATAAGRQAAQVIAAGVADAGVHVVSGLARGIDGCAHRAVVEGDGPGRPIGVVASGLDVVYPREHRELWRSVAEAGVLVTEAPPGTSPEAWRFPMRNRIIASLAEVVVVVESRERGGSLITSTMAGELGVPVMAVPGSVHNPAAAGTNELLRNGAGPVLDASDVLVALELDHRRAIPQLVEARQRPRSCDLDAYRAVAAEPLTIDGIVAAVDGPLLDVAMSLARLEHAGWVAETDGWYQVVGAPLR